MNSKDAGPTAQQVLQWLTVIDADLSQVQASIDPLLDEQTRLQERRQLLQRLLGSLERGPATEENAESPEPPTLVSGNGASSIRERVHAHAVAVLQEAGRDLHINEIHMEFVKRGFPIPGAGKPVNITVHLASSPVIQSPKRGFYRIQSNNEAAPKVPSRGPRLRRTARSKTRRSRKVGTGK